MVRHRRVLGQPAHDSLQGREDVGDGELSAHHEGHRRVGDVLHGHQDVVAVARIDVLECSGREGDQIPHVLVREATLHVAFGLGGPDEGLEHRRVRLPDPPDVATERQELFGRGVSFEPGWRGLDELTVAPLGHRLGNEAIARIRSTGRWCRWRCRSVPRSPAPGSRRSRRCGPGPAPPRSRAAAGPPAIGGDDRRRAPACHSRCPL